MPKPQSSEENFRFWAKKLRLPADALREIECLIQDYCMVVARYDARLAKSMRQALFERARMALPSTDIVAYVTEACVTFQEAFFLYRAAGRPGRESKRMLKKKRTRS